MRRKTAIVLLVCICLFVAGCSKSSEEQELHNPKKVMVLAASSLTDVLNQVKQNFEQTQNEYVIEFSFDSSGTLKTQIEQGVDGDVFFSASQVQIQQLSEKGLIDQDETIELLTNEIVLTSNREVKDPITSFEQLVLSDDVDMIATCMEEVPVGQYTMQIYRNLGLEEQLRSKANYAGNVRQVLEWVASGNCSYGIVYATDAAIEQDVVVQAVADSSLYDEIIYPVSLLTNSSQKEGAKAFLQYLETKEAKEIFQQYGFETKS